VKKLPQNILYSVEGQKIASVEGQKIASVEGQKIAMRI